MAKDPVCHMEVDPRRSAGKSVHQGTEYYFCSVGCKRQFDGNPVRFSR